jgi:hypothetical protein
LAVSAVSYCELLLDAASDAGEAFRRLETAPLLLTNEQNIDKGDQVEGYLVVARGDPSVSPDFISEVEVAEATTVDHQQPRSITPPPPPPPPPPAQRRLSVEARAPGPQPIAGGDGSANEAVDSNSVTPLVEHFDLPPATKLLVTSDANEVTAILNSQVRIMCKLEMFGSNC